MAKKCEMKEMLLVGTKVKAAIKEQDCMCASEVMEALNCKVHCLIASAAARTKANKRSTVKAHDL